MRFLLRRAPVAALLAVVLAACSRTVPSGDDIRPVRAMVVAPAAVSVVADLPGELRPRLETRVGFQVGGRIVARNVELGQAVKAGQILATLDAADYKLAAAAAREALVAAQTDRDQQRADYKRFQELHAKGFISAADLERRKSALDAAEARYKQAAAQAEVSGNQADYAVLKAPTAGVITGVDAEAGQVVAAGQSVVRLAPTAEKEIAIAIPESRLADLRRIPEVRVSLWAGGKDLRGKVREISPVADPATRTFPARITLLDVPADAAFGMTATVKFETPVPTAAVLLPLQALLREGDATYIWLLDRNAMTVKRVAIKVASIAGNEVAVAGGVQPGDAVVTAGVHLLKDGQRVKLLDEKLFAPAASAKP
ncbi:MAG: efflux RND transporter periplasmic adaptor subunit [Betaproteobacteria bacterium]